MLSTNQKADIINKILHKRGITRRCKSKLSDIELFSIHEYKIKDSMIMIMQRYGIDPIDCLLAHAGALYVIHPVKLDALVDKKFEELGGEA